jgi:hypothetical protein
MSPPTEPGALLAELSLVRRDYLAAAPETRREPPVLRRLASDLERSAVLRQEPAAAALIEDLGRENGVLDGVKQHINQQVDNRVLSVFSARYFPSLSLDFFEYAVIPSDSGIVAGYPSPTMPVNLVAWSEGYSDRVVVALFPENHIDGQQTPQDLIFYFIDKFVSRHALTRRLVSEALAPGLLPALHAAGTDDVTRAAASWVRLHEYHHRIGDMPIPHYLKEKSYKPLAGLEELRTDVSSMLACLNDGSLDRELAQLTYEFILAERLLRYSVEGIPKPNYDAISSQLLFNYLRQHRALTIRQDRIHLGDNLPEVLADFRDEVAAREALVHSDGVAVARQRLLEFAMTCTNYDSATNTFHHIPYFADLKARLGV